MCTWKDLGQQAHVENVRIFEVTIDPNRKDLLEATPNIGPVLEVMVTKDFDRY